MINKKKKQNFENTFFNLIKIHNDLVANFREFHIPNDETKHFMYGGEAISYFLDNFKEGGFTGFYSPDESLSKEENIKYRVTDISINEINNFFLENINSLYIEENISKKIKFINK